jgi:hypothetical protein
MPNFEKGSCMFWESIGTGLSILTYWQTYVAGLMFLALSMGPVFIIGTITMKSGRAEGFAGCLSMLVLPFFQVFALFVFVLTMSPIILGLSQEAAWLYPWLLTADYPWEVTKFVGKLLLAAIVLALIPILGRLQSLHTLLLGGLALFLVVAMIGVDNPALASKAIHFWPGFWFFVGLLVIGSVMAWLGLIVAALTITFIEKRAEGIGQLLVFPIAAVFGFIPLFIYGAWIGAQIRG